MPTTMTLTRKSMTMANRKTAVDTITRLQECLYDADQILGRVRITKETAEQLGEVMRQINEADRLATAVIEELS